MDENVNLLQIKPEVVDHIRLAVSEAYDKPEFQIRFNPQNKFYYIFINDEIEPIPINILTGVPLEETMSNLVNGEPDSLFDIDYIKRSNDFNEDYIVHKEFIPDNIFDVDYLIRSTSDNDTKVLCRYMTRSGTRGQRWGHRYHQSYRVKPRRSGKIGEEHGDAKRQTERLSHNNDKEDSNKKKNIVSKTVDSAKKLYNDYENKKTKKQIAKINKLKKKSQKLYLKKQEIQYKNMLKNQKEYNKFIKKNKGNKVNKLSKQEIMDKGMSLMADDPKVIMKKWKGKLNNDDLAYLQRRMGLETHINKQINPPFDFAKAYRNVSMVGKGILTANNVMADFYNTVNANDIESGKTKPWPSTRVVNYNYNNKKKKNKNKRNHW